MEKFNITFSKIAVAIAFILLVLGVFGSWYVVSSDMIPGAAEEMGGMEIKASSGIFMMSNLKGNVSSILEDIPVPGIEKMFDQFFSFGATTFLMLLAVLILLASTAVVTMYFTGNEKFAKYGAWGVGGISVITFFITLLGKPVLKLGKIMAMNGMSEEMKALPSEIKPDLGYGIILVLIGGIIMVAAPFIDDLLNGKMSVGGAGNASYAAPVNPQYAPNTQAYSGNQNSLNNQAPVNTGKKFCPRCGAEVANGTPFCTSCGNKLA